jgi:hypothetical protein
MHLNYCRSAVKYFSGVLASGHYAHDIHGPIKHIINLAQASQKFLLPEGGRLYDDPEYKALDEKDTLNLPYPLIAMEYSRDRMPECIGKDEVHASKCILFARETDDAIVLTPVFWAEEAWHPMPEAALPRRGYLNRSVMLNGRVSIRLGRADDRIPMSDYADEVGALLCLLNVLGCRNVHVAKSTPKNHKTKVKSALPFDAYSILTIDAPSKGGSILGMAGNHRSPREHLRRGHIRRLEDGRRIWVSATVVGSSNGSGTVKKDYRVKRVNSIREGAAK